MTQAQKSFEGLPLNFKFFYLDTDNDLISMSSQEDLEEALDCMQSASVLKLFIADSIHEAKDMVSMSSMNTSVYSDAFKSL